MAGEIEAVRPGEYLAGHTACHAFMNGIDRVALFGPTDPSDPDEVAESMRRLLDSGPVDLVVAPGVSDPGRARTLVDTFADWHQRSPEAVSPTSVFATLWLDPPQNATVVEALEHLDSLSSDRERVKMAVPYVETHTPGRRGYELLPPSCLVAPLYLGTTPALKGAHSLGRRPTYSEEERLRESGCGLLVADGRRRQVRLAFPPPNPRRQPQFDDTPMDLRSRIERALEEACQPLLDGRPTGPSLWRSVERQIKSALLRFKQRGEIVDFKCRCDAETNQDLVDGLGVEVLVKFPKRVKHVIINLTMSRL